MIKRIALLTICAFCLITMASFSPRQVEVSTVTVQAYTGDTMWKICSELYDQNDVRSFDEFMYDVRKENNLLGNNVLQAGQVVRITKKVRK